jgi:hypothetical protein
MEWSEGNWCDMQQEGMVWKGKRKHAMTSYWSVDTLCKHTVRRLTAGCELVAIGYERV